MKKLLCLVLSLLVLLMLCACGADKAEEKTEYYKLKEYVCYDTGDVNLHENTYDGQWNLLSQQSFLNGEKASGVEYTYSEDYTQVTINYWSNLYEPDEMLVEREFDSEGRVVKAVSYSAGEYESTEEYTYDNQGNLLRVGITYHDGTEAVTENEYDEKGNLLSSGYSMGASYSIRNEHSYDKHGRLGSTERFQNGQLTSRAEYSYEGNVRHGSSYDAEGNLLGKTESVLDEAGNCLEAKEYDLNGNMQRHTYTVYAGTDGSISGALPEE